MGDGPTAVAVTIHGRVQGVAFRYWTRREAERLGLSGWVRNEPDGTVSALFAGPSAAVAAMLAACEHGPDAARVTRVLTRPADPAEAGEGFAIRH